MSHLVDKEFIERANSVVLLSILWGALAACVLGALAFDIGHWWPTGKGVADCAEVPLRPLDASPAKARPMWLLRSR